MYIPDRVKRQLRAEVGFGCPVEGCGSPYLTYHHFDPPRRVREHNEPAGMVALCREDHDAAEGGAFTVDQLRSLKRDGLERNARIAGQFRWRRQQLIVHVGQILSFETKIPLAFNGVPVISLTRAESRDLLVSINMLTSSVLPRLRMFENDWVSIGKPTDLESPPYARKLRAVYPNGEELGIEFRSINDIDDLAAALPGMSRVKDWAHELTTPEYPEITPPLVFPVVLVDVSLELPEVGLSITSEGITTQLGTVGDSCAAYSPCALSLGHIRCPIPTVYNTVELSLDRPQLRFASMNGGDLWHISDRHFQQMLFLLDGYNFERCSFDQCAFTTRGKAFGLNGNNLGNSPINPSPDIQEWFWIMKALSEAGVSNFVDASEKLGIAAVKGREVQKQQQGKRTPSS